MHELFCLLIFSLVVGHFQQQTFPVPYGLLAWVLLPFLGWWISAPASNSDKINRHNSEGEFGWTLSWIPSWIFSFETRLWSMFYMSEMEHGKIICPLAVLATASRISCDQAPSSHETTLLFTAVSPPRTWNFPHSLSLPPPVPVCCHRLFPCFLMWLFSLLFAHTDGAQWIPNSVIYLINMQLA